MTRRPDWMERREFLRLSAAGITFVARTGEASVQMRNGASAKTPGTGWKTLLVYFSRAGENYFNGGRKVLAIGNTEVVARMIHDATGCDVFQIKPREPYSDRYEPTVQRNVLEQDARARPDIVGMPRSIAAYDTILLGSPIWNVRAPRIMLTFAEHLDFAGKTIYPFTTHAMSGLATTRKK